MSEEEDTTRLPHLAIDISNINSSRELHILLKERLRFPDFYGNNWNAFWDAITGLVDMPYAITFVGWDNLTQKLPEDARILHSQLDDFNRKFANVGYTCDVEYK